MVEEWGRGSTREVYGEEEEEYEEEEEEEEEEE